MKQTKGTWRFNSDKTCLLALNKNNEYTKVLDVTTGVEPTSKDAALISSAPEMLEALELTLQLLREQARKATIHAGASHQDSVELNFVVRAAEQAISKAKGA
jgi:hypothetical protein